ncbi:MAG: crossover junction endodeoxyribonuclease RuvC [Candidatus Aminicenantes bacterium]|jgi:crossover junction endodeoxyribonuclease RuvC
MRVLGIDPSVKSTGYSILEYSGDDYSVLAYGVIKPSRQKVFHHKINEIKRAIEGLIQDYKPEEVAIENPFYAQNIKTAITLGQVRGATLIAVASQGKPLYEYSALEIKKAVTGYGQADKHQVKTMVKTLLNIEDDRMETDASDALATAYCHLNSRLFQKKIEESPQ